MSGLISQIPVTETAFSNLQWLEGQRTTGESVKIPPALMQTGPNIGLFTSIGSVTVPTGVNVVQTSGYSTVGVGQGAYVSDSLATSALAASCPNFCALSADGRYWRLDGDYITVEQGGATGTPGVNDQPAIQATVTYAHAVSIRMVLFGNAAYELWTPTRVSSGGYGNTSAVTGDGYPLIITKAIGLYGLPGGSTLTFKDNSGANRVQSSGWIGGGIYVNPNSPGTTADIPYVVLENLILAGTTPYTGPTNAGSNITDKGLGFVSNGTYNVDYCRLRNVTAYNFSGEIFYGASFAAGSTIIVENVELYNSNQSAWNSNSLGKVFATNLNAHDAYLASEIITGGGQTYVGCRFANSYSGGTIGTEFFANPFSYYFPNRYYSVPPYWFNYIDCTIQNIQDFEISSWTRGRIITIDAGITFGTPCKEIDLDVVHWADQKGVSVMSLSGPATTTTQFSSCPSPATFSGTIASASNQLVVTGVTGTIYANMTLTGVTGGSFNVPGNIQIQSQVSGTTGGAGTYLLNQTNNGGGSASVTGSGVYYEITKNIYVNIVCKSTSNAQANGYQTTGVALYSGLYDQNTVQINVEGDVNNVYTVPGSVVSGFAVPLITAQSIAPTGQPFGGTYSYPSANVALDVGWSAMTFYSSGSGPWSVTLNNTYNYADGQLVTFYLGAGSTAKMTFAATGAGMKLTRPRTLAVSGDRLVLRWSKRLTIWEEEAFLSAQQLVFTGSATYDAPSIAAGGTTTTTVTVTGAALGDYVSSVSLGISSAGLVITGYVSAANTVTVVLYNPTAGAIDLASTTLSIEVMKKVS